MRTDNSKKFIFVSIFGEQPGHSVKDIAFYFDALLHWEVEFEYYMPEFSMRQLREGVEFARHIEVHDDGSWRDAFKIASQVLVKNNSTVVFTGYTEKIVIAFWFLNLWKSYDLVLSATNNFSYGRVRRNIWFLRVFFLAISRKIKRLVVHSEAEKQLVESISSGVAKIATIKHHHQFKRRESLNIHRLHPTISFYGPVKYNKPIEPLYDLIESDLYYQFNYHLYNVGNLSGIRFEKIRQKKNVKIINHYLSEEELSYSIQNSSLVFLSHDSSYEGLLSGNFMDCVANAIPFLSGKNSVHAAFEETYGYLGVTFDFNDSKWSQYFLSSFKAESATDFEGNLVNMNAFFNQEALLKSFNETFLLKLDVTRETRF